MLVDSHCHLDQLDLTAHQGSLDVALAAAREAGVGHFLCVGLGPNIAEVVAIAEKISAMETASFFEQRAALGSPHTAQAAWDKVGDKAALVDDKWTQ